MPPDAPTHAEQWQDLLEAHDFAERQFGHWARDGSIRRDQHAAIQGRYEVRKEKWQRARESGLPLPPQTDLQPCPRAELPAQRLIRQWDYTRTQVRCLAEERLFGLAQMHQLELECEEHIGALERQLTLGEVPVAVAVEVEVPTEDALAERPVRKTASGKAPRRPFMEILLDPRNIQWLLASGGALMVIGIVILLWVNEVFTPPIVAVSLGAANAALLLAGWWAIHATRYQLAGRALTLIACLIMPLNLWYYHANQLITLDGHLWLAGVVVCVLYAASAFVLRDELFAYVFMAGVTLTGLLFLADLPPSPQKFWEIASPVTLLVVLGLLAIHAERVFPAGEGPFSRQRFGMAFFRSGQVLLAGGLLLLLAAHVMGRWLYEPVFKPLFAQFKAEPSPVVGELHWLSLLLAALGTYAYVYSDVVVRRIGVYVHVAAFTLLWTLVLLVEELGLSLGIDALILVFSLTGLVVNIVHSQFFKDRPLTRALPLFGLVLPFAAVLLGVLAYARAISPDLKSAWAAKPPDWTYLVGLMVTAVTCRVSAYLRRETTWELTTYLFGTAAAVQTAAATLLAILGLERWTEHGPILMVLPILYVVVARAYRGRAAEKPLLWVSHTAAAFMLISSLATTVEGLRMVEQQAVNLSLALFFAVAACFYGLAAGLHRQAAAMQASALLGCAAAWQILTYVGVPGEYYTLAFALVGLVMLVCYRLALVERVGSQALAHHSFQCANALLSLSFIAAVLLGLSRLALRDVQWSFVGLSLTLAMVSLLAIALVRHSAWRRWYLVTTLGQAVLAFLSLMVLSTLSGWQKLEIFSVCMGLLVLVVGHIGWYRERERESDLVSLSLLVGSLMLGVPLAIATVVDRSRDQFLFLNEFGFLTAGVLLLTTGFVFRLKSTTLTGTGLTALYFLSLLIFVPWSRLNAVALFITIGGGTLFVLGLILSVFRDRLLTLPERIRRREGLFRVLGWR
jgi:hypothetical protein